jgi:isopenicillin-N N-acyltransferase-like protein
MIMERLPLIDLSGSPFEIGYAHGLSLREQIQKNFNLYLNMIRNNTGLAEQEIVGMARRFIPEIERSAPKLLEEMAGISKGAELSLETLLTLNSRSELAFPDQLSAQCTVIGLTTGRTSDRHTFIAQNWDWLPAVKANSALFRIAPDSGPRALVLAEAGQVGKLGFNEHGLGLVINLLVSTGIRFGIPAHVGLRQLLAAADIAEAVEQAKRTRWASSCHILLGDANGGIMGLEVSPFGVVEFSPQNGVIAHTNHFCDPLMRKNDLAPDLLPDSIIRLDRARQLLAEREKWDVAGIKQLLADHHSPPLSICRHEAPEIPEHLRMCTLVSLIFDLARRSAEIAYGQPCRTDYYQVNL